MMRMRRRKKRKRKSKVQLRLRLVSRGSKMEKERRGRHPRSSTQLTSNSAIQFSLCLTTSLIPFAFFTLSILLPSRLSFSCRSFSAVVLTRRDLFLRSKLLSWPYSTDRRLLLLFDSISHFMIHRHGTSMAIPFTSTQFNSITSQLQTHSASPPFHLRRHLLLLPLPCRP